MTLPLRDPSAPALSERDIEALDQALAELAARPGAGQALDAVSLDGYLCGVLLQPAPVPEPAWLPGVFDVEAPGAGPSPLQALAPQAAFVASLARRRHAELAAAIARRSWFDPWVYELDDPALPPAQATLPWVAGFAAAMDRFPGLMALDHPGLLEPLAVLYAVFDPEDLEDADELLALIEELEPASTLQEAVEDLVHSVLRLADVSLPLPPGGRGRQPPPARSGAPARRPSSGPPGRGGPRRRP